MSNELIKKRYFDWMCSVVGNRLQYSRLLEYLNEREFEWHLEMDSNRYSDGEDLRYAFGREIGLDDRTTCNALDHNGCSILEMMVALSRRCEKNVMFDEDKGDRTGVWFWSMIESLGLDELSNGMFTRRKADVIINRFNNREYDADGRGSLFYVPDSKIDMHSLDIWHQMHAYLEKYYEGE